MAAIIQSGKDLAQYIDHTVLKPGLLLSQVETACREAIENGFASVCVPPMFVKTASRICGPSNMLVATVIGFPFGYCAVEAKIAESVLAMVDGADELDVVINYTALKNGDYQFLANEINHLMPVIKSKNKTIKVIIESGVLTDEEIKRCCDIYGVAGVDFVKTSTGYAEKGASLEAVRLIRTHLADQIGIKASGGIRTYEFAKALVEAGATRLGCSSSLQIIAGEDAEGNY